MASTLLEQTRAAHEECERLQRQIVRDFKSDVKGHREKLAQGHRVRKMLNELQVQSQKLVRIYEDEDGARKEEIAALKGDDNTGFGAFYERLKEVRDYHRRYPYLEVIEAVPEEEALKEQVDVPFSGEEVGGRYLDMHTHYHAFVNSKFGRQCDYVEYLVTFGHTDEISRQHRLSKPYREYLDGLLRYMESFHERTQPLGSLEKVYAKLGDFDALWAAGEVPGWADRGQGTAGEDASSAIDVAAFASVEELETLGPDRLKEALAALGLKSGGTLRQRAERLFLTRDTPLTQLDRKHFAKGAAPAAVRSAEENARISAAAQDTALLEAKVKLWSEVFASVIEDTKGYVEKKQASTYEEIVAEQEQKAEEDAAAEDSDEEDDFVYNPLKLPLGWDGKPIPYWLYKLHGLNQEFTCEICGGQSYWGRRAFERHFKEWRHQNGMRALGIPNTKTFFEVTQMKDALELWTSIKEREVGGFKAEAEEEYEDKDGNVYNKRTYEDLKRQGLI
ncbi:hypothetical protein WJX75_008099 [Coccomyxa subellipsoidea]|uniref:Matrin-type domain-containing protein n=1 Tax=Coccomyxa subellipsoidea TaxID=248742 RepID=A0ABR2YJZ6_9CHLO